VREHRYRIVVSGALGALGREAFDGFKIESAAAHTALIADLDQSGLHGALNRIAALRLELVEVVRLATS
jgi:hypothetical protein